MLFCHVNLTCNWVVTVDERRKMHFITYISKTESGRVSKEILGTGSGSGTRWALGG